MKMLKKKIKRLFTYPANMEQVIKNHEEQMLQTYSEIIDKKYRVFFESYGLEVETILIWERLVKGISSRSRIKSCIDYSCSVCCEIKKNGQIVKIPSRDGEIDYYPLVAGWEITRINFPFSNPPYSLFQEQIEEVLNDMNELKELFDEFE